ncbi:MAG: glycosyltransferase [Bacillota bacterium]
MHIVLVIDQFDTLNNGTTASARRYAEELRKRGHRVTILAAGETRQDKIGVPVLKIPFFQRLIEQQGFPLAKPIDEAYYQAFREADIVHFYLPTWFCRRGEDIARQMKVPTVTAFHLQPENITYSIGPGRWRWASDFLYRYFYRTFYNP